MTSRLKHKLELENINLKSSYLNESFVQVGTPLPALAEGRKDKLEYVPEWQQEVRDEKGRRRFHGAFTGGFSAGYYNSVGSKEGWTPSTFKSSRSNRAQHAQRPEDFMDEEDLEALKADRQLENTDTFRSDRLGSTQAEVAQQGALESLIAPARTSIGQKLLQTQGWRPGQGIGPRVSYAKRKKQDAKMAGPSGNGVGPFTGQSGEEGEAEAEASKHTFAPRDTKLLVFPPKEDQAGLGYVPGMGGSLARSAPLAFRANHVQGVDDDDDPYGQAGPSSSSRHFAFDHDEDDAITIGGPSTLRASASSFPSHVDHSRRSATDTAHYHDGRPVLSGFELDPLSAPPDKWFALPDIPPDWRPRPARVWGTTRQWDKQPGQVEEKAETIKGAPGRPLTADQRGEALGEVDTRSKSVFEFMSAKDRDRLQSFIASAKADPSLSGSAPPSSSDIPARPTQDSTEVIVPPLSPRTAGAALNGFIPYGDDLPRQERYKSYLSSQTYNTKTPDPILHPGTLEQVNKELEDFAASARIFKPMSFAMSSRFTSGSASLAVSDLKQAKPGLHMYDASKAAEVVVDGKDNGIVKGSEDSGKPLGPREQAAKDGKYGTATRLVKAFYPTKLVCRRFGVQDPHPEGEPKGIDVGTSNGGLDSLPLPKNDASWESSFVHQGVPTSFGSGKNGNDAKDDGDQGNDDEDEVERAPRTLADVGMPGDSNQGRDTLTYVKPDIDIFKAIFAEDDSDDEDGEAGEGGDERNDGDEDEDVPAQELIARQARKRAEEVKRKREQEREEREKEKQQGPVDLATFKPVFVRKLARSTEDGAGEKDKSGSEAQRSKKKRKKESKKLGGVLSFQTEDGEGEGEWVEKKIKAAPALLTSPSSVPLPASLPSVTREGREDREDEVRSEEARVGRVGKVGKVGKVEGRKGAEHFM